MKWSSRQEEPTGLSHGGHNLRLGTRQVSWTGSSSDRTVHFRGPFEPGVPDSSAEAHGGVPSVRGPACAGWCTRHHGRLDHGRDARLHRSKGDAAGRSGGPRQSRTSGQSSSPRPLRPCGEDARLDRSCSVPSSPAPGAPPRCDARRCDFGARPDRLPSQLCSAGDGRPRSRRATVTSKARFPPEGSPGD